MHIWMWKRTREYRSLNSATDRGERLSKPSEWNEKIRHTKQGGTERKGKWGCLAAGIAQGARAGRSGLARDLESL